MAPLLGYLRALGAAIQTRRTAMVVLVSGVIRLALGLR
jgi:hypothetical protein